MKPHCTLQVKPHWSLPDLPDHTFLSGRTDSVTHWPPSAPYIFLHGLCAENIMSSLKWATIITQCIHTGILVFINLCFYEFYFFPTFKVLYTWTKCMGTNIADCCEPYRNVFEIKKWNKIKITEKWKYIKGYRLRIWWHLKRVSFSHSDFKHN